MGFLDNVRLAEWLASLALQGLLVGAVIWLVLVALRRASPTLRSTAGICGVALLVALPILVLASQLLDSPRVRLQFEPRTTEVAENPVSAPITAEKSSADPKSLIVPPEKTLARAEQASARSWNLIPLMIVLGAIWVIGMVVAMVRMIAGMWALGRLRDCLPAAPDDQVAPVQEVLAHESGMTVPEADVYLSSEDLPPFCFGLRRYGIVLPASAAECEHALEATLAHEMAHLGQNDPALGVLQRIMAAVHWWNPFAHLINREVSLVREILCDREVVRVTGDAERYARFLVELNKKLIRPPGTLAAASATGAFHTMKERIRLLLSDDTCRPRPPRHGLRLGVAASLALLTGIAAFGIGTDFSNFARPPGAPESPVEEPDREIPTKGLLLHLPLQSDFADVSSREHPIKAMGDVRILDHAAYFDGDDDVLELPPLALNKHPFAISLWLKLTGAPSTHGILHQPSARTPLGHLHCMLRERSEVSIPYFGFMVEDLKGSGPVRPENGWTHLVFQHTGTHMEIWRNALLESKAMKPAYQGSPTPIFLGETPKWNNVNSSDWEGFMRELRIYQGSLDESEIRALKAEGHALGIPDTSNHVEPFYTVSTSNDKRALVAGLRIWFEDGYAVGMQPIFDSDDGRGKVENIEEAPLGKMLGEARGTEELIWPGPPFVMGGLFADRNDEGVTGIGVAYFKREGNRLNSDKVHMTNWIGQPPITRQPSLMGGNGKWILGVSARFGAGGRISRLGVIQPDFDRPAGAKTKEEIHAVGMRHWNFE